MSFTASSHDVPPLEMIGAMTQCAYQLGVTASGIAQSAGDDLARFLAFSTEFRHCFFAVRMGIRLSQFEVVAPRVAAASVETPDRERTERADRDDARGRIEADRDRERDREPVSLPQFLKTLGLVAKNAEQVRAELPAHIRDTTLPTLHALLRQATATPEREPVALLARPPTTPAVRSRLLNSTGTHGVSPGPPPQPPILPPRRSSG